MKKTEMKNLANCNFKKQIFKRFILEVIFNIVLNLREKVWFGEGRWEKGKNQEKKID
jgi:hypothetical protein